MKRLLLVVFVAFCLVSCHPVDPEVKDRQVLLIYLLGNNNLSDNARIDLNDIKASWLPEVKDDDQVVLVYYHFLDEAPVLCRLYKDRKGNAAEEVISTYPAGTNSAKASTLKMVLDDAFAAWPANRQSLILWSHGSGFLPEGYYAKPKEGVIAKGLNEDIEADPFAAMVKAAQSKSYGEDRGSEMDIMDLCCALSGRHYKFILFDACLMANVEVAYEMRRCCDYLMFSPTEILADGFPYEKMVQPIFTMKPKDALTDIAKSYMAHYRAQSGDLRSATITIVQTDRLENLARACRPIFENHNEQILILDRSRVQPYFRLNRHWFYDLGDFLDQIVTEEERQSLSFYRDPDTSPVIFKDATERFLGIEMKNVSGLSIYIPREEYAALNTYYKKLEWNKDTKLVQ